MPLSKPLIGKLRLILRKNYGADVTEAEAEEIGTNLVRYYDHLAMLTYREVQPKEEKPP